MAASVSLSPMEVISSVATVSFSLMMGLSLIHICTVGAYALANRQAYMACGQTARPLRGKGIGGRCV